MGNLLSRAPLHASLSAACLCFFFFYTWACSQFPPVERARIASSWGAAPAATMQSRFPCRCLQSARVESAISFSDSLETSRGHPRSGGPRRGRWRGRPWSLHARIAGGNCSPESAAAPPSRTARRFARPSLIPVKAASENLPGACDLVEAGPLETSRSRGRPWIPLPNNPTTC